MSLSIESFTAPATSPTRRASLEGDYKFYEKLLGFSSPSSDKLKKTYFETDQRNPIYVICSTNMFTTWNALLYLCGRKAEARNKQEIFVQRKRKRAGGQSRLSKKIETYYVGDFVGNIL